MTKRKHQEETLVCNLWEASPTKFFFWGEKLGAHWVLTKRRILKYEAMPTILLPWVIAFIYIKQINLIIKWASVSLYCSAVTDSIFSSFDTSKLSTGYLLFRMCINILKSRYPVDQLGRYPPIGRYVLSDAYRVCPSSWLFWEFWNTQWWRTDKRYASETNNYYVSQSLKVLF